MDNFFQQGFSVLFYENFEIFYDFYPQFQFLNYEISSGNKKSISYKNISYEVIGIIGYSIPTKLDKTVMLKLDSDLLGSRFLYSINGNSKQKRFDFLGNESLFGNVSVYDREYPSILKVIDSDKRQVMNIVAYGIVLIFNAFLLCYIWIERKTDEIIVKKINGYSNRLILINICGESSILISLGYAMGVAIALIYNMNKYAINFPACIFSYITTLTISLSFVIYITKSILMVISTRKLGVSC